MATENYVTLHILLEVQPYPKHCAYSVVGAPCSNEQSFSSAAAHQRCIQVITDLMSFLVITYN